MLNTLNNTLNCLTNNLNVTINNTLQTLNTLQQQTTNGEQLLQIKQYYNVICEIAEYVEKNC